VIDPRRGPQDLILPATLHRQVLEVAGFFRAWPKAAATWNLDPFGRGGGIKALFTGDSGTGKTLAAEVIASELGLSLLKVDLAQVVSKWVGETEKHLENAFREAEDSQAVLFFDEADALFGKRGEVQHGVDRYANLEVSYLLQRLEEYSGIVVLASNLKDNIDQAFTRRFHVVLHFPRPEVAERRRIWEIALPPDTPWEQDLDLDILAKFDLTGAGIVNAARTAALMAAASNSQIISKTGLVQAIARQYRREARVLGASELGPYAEHLRDAR
jgi:SpoVK/Ycf46/Vps4 family AAA+-type ATPase